MPEIVIYRPRLWTSQLRFCFQVFEFPIKANKIEPGIILLVCRGTLWNHDSRGFRFYGVDSRISPNHLSRPVIPLRCNLRHVFLPVRGLYALGVMRFEQSIDDRANRNAGARATVRETDFHVVHVVEESASRTVVSSSSLSKGLCRNAEAPASNATERTSESSFPVKMITRVEGEIFWS